MLVDAGVDLLTLCDYGCTALHYAAMGSHLMQLEVRRPARHALRAPCVRPSTRLLTDAVGPSLALQILLKHPDAEKAKEVVDKEGKTPIQRAKDALEKNDYTKMTPSIQARVARWSAVGPPGSCHAPSIPRVLPVA